MLAMLGLAPPPLGKKAHIGSQKVRLRLLAPRVALTSGSSAGWGTRLKNERASPSPTFPATPNLLYSRRRSALDVPPERCSDACACHASEEPFSAEERSEATNA